MEKNIKICLIGPIGAGKTSLLNTAKNQDIQTFNSDQILKEKVYVDKSVVKKLVDQKFKTKQDNTVDFSEIIKAINSDTRLVELETLLHPMLEEHLLEWFDKTKTEEMILAEIPLVFEAGWTKYFDEIWYVEPWYEQDKSYTQTPHKYKNWPDFFVKIIEKRQKILKKNKEKCQFIIENKRDFEKKLQVYNSKLNEV